MNTSPINLLGVSGSPRVGATNFAVKAALNYARDKYSVKTDYFTVRAKKIKFCIHCDHCVRHRKGCAHKDDVQELYPKLEWANAWLLGTPVYQGQISGQLKVILDRCRALVAKDPKVFVNKIGAAVAVGGDRNGGQEPALQTIIDFYIINEMIPVGGGSFGANLGGTVWSQDKGAQGAEEDSEGIKATFKAVDRLIKVASLLHKQASQV
jgi:multimeric flavodoxin WrbA